MTGPLKALVARVREVLARARSALASEGTLLQQSVTGGVWLTAMNVAGRAFQLATVVVLARFLTPRAFGVIGAAMLVIVGLRRVSDLGLEDALIYDERSDVDASLDTVWVLNALRGIVVAAGVYAVAPLVASVFDVSPLTAVLRVVAIGPVLLGIENPAVVYFEKDLAFHRRFAYEVSGEAGYFLAAVAYALRSPTVWALAAGYLARTGIRVVLSYLLADYRPRPGFDRERARELLDYGKWITGASLATYLRHEGDDAFVGWLLGAAPLGYYQLAYRLSNAPATEVTNVISGVTFPAYAEVQDEPATLRQGFYRTVRLSATLVAPMAVGIAVVAPTFVRGFLGRQWLPMVVPMQILSLYGGLRGYGATYGPVWRATGKPHYLVWTQALSVACIAALIYPATARWGIAGAAAVIGAVELFVNLPLATYLAVDAVGGSYRRLLGEFAYPLPAAGLMGLVVVWTDRSVASLPESVEFVLLVAVGVLTYAGAALAIDAGIDWGIVEEIDELRDAI